MNFLEHLIKMHPVHSEGLKNAKKLVESMDDIDGGRQVDTSVFAATTTPIQAIIAGITTNDVSAFYEAIVVLSQLADETRADHREKFGMEV